MALAAQATSLRCSVPGPYNHFLLRREHPPKPLRDLRLKAYVEVCPLYNGTDEPTYSNPETHQFLNPGRTPDLGLRIE